MRRHSLLLAVVALCAWASQSQAAPILTLFNTGVNASGTPLPNGSLDPHYSLIPPSLIVGTPFVRTSAAGFPVSPFGPWVADNSISAWITPSPQAQGPNGNYFYRTTFDLTGFDSSTAQIMGQWATDNPGLDILINGVSTGQTNVAQFTVFSPFSILSGFVPGINTLDFIVQEQGVVTGLRVQMTGTAEVPEPGTLALFGLVGLALGGFTLRRKPAVAA